MVIFHSYVKLPTGRGVCPEGKTQGLTQQPSTHCKIHLTSIRASFKICTSYKIPRPNGTISIFLLRFHLGLGFVQVINCSGPMEQCAIFLLRFHVYLLIQVIKYPAFIEQLAIFLSGFHLGFVYVSKSPGPMDN